MGWLLMVLIQEQILEFEFIKPSSLILGIELVHIISKKGISFTTIPDNIYNNMHWSSNMLV